MQRDTQFQYVSIDKITELLGDDGDLLEKSGNPQEDTNLADIGAESDTAKPTDEVGAEARVDVPRTGRKKRKYGLDETDQHDPLPLRYRHIRKSERKVREEVYKTMANLTGNGLSLDEACNALIDVGNGLFGRNWKKGDLAEDVLTVKHFLIREVSDKL